MSFENLKYQVRGQWQSIEAADPATRRVLMGELIRSLQEWEASDTASLDAMQTLKRITYKAQMAKSLADEIPRLLDILGPNRESLKKLLQTQMDTLKAEHGILQARLRKEEEGLEAGKTAMEVLCKAQEEAGRQCAARMETLRQEIRKLEESLNLKIAEHGAMAGEKKRLEGQLGELHQLESLRQEIREAAARMKDLEKGLDQGKDPGPGLQDWASLTEKLVSYYRTCTEVSRTIGDNLLQAETGLPPVRIDTAMLEVPARLLALKTELDEMDILFAAHLKKQDAEDETARQRVHRGVHHP